MSAATFAHAMSRMSAIAPSVASSAGRMEPIIASRIGVTVASFVLSHLRRVVEPLVEHLRERRDGRRPCARGIAARRDTRPTNV